jgi:hypothetical protein
MSVNREYRCTAHDYEFESTEEHPPCPYGCSPRFVQMEFRTPPSIRHLGTRNTDILQKQLASDYGLTDMRNDKDGTSVMHSTRTASGGLRKNFEPHQQAKWAPNLFQPQHGWAQRGEEAPVYRHDKPGTHTAMKPILDAAPPVTRQTVFLKPNT